MRAEVIEHFALGAVILVLFCYFFVRRLWKKDQARNLELYQTLRSSSIRNAANAFDMRIALATREAAKGFRVCVGCGFENALHGTSCALCGAMLPEEIKGLSRLLSRSKEDRVKQTRGNETSRQCRVRRRRLWKRRGGGSGPLLWHFDAQLDGTQHPSYVLTITTADLGAANVDRDGGYEESSPEADAHQVAIKVEELTLGEVSRRLQIAFTESSMRIVPVKNGDEVSLIGLADDKQKTRAHESARDSQLDFPTKIARFIGCTSALFKEATQEGNEKETPVARFHVLRGSLVKDSVEAVASLTPVQSRGAIRAEFVGEQGIDAGGVYREWVQLMNRAIASPEAGIFTCVNSHDQVFSLNRHSREALGEDHLAHLLVAGRLLGRALLEGNTTGFHLAQPLLKMILGLPVSLNDLEYFDPDVHKNLKWLLDNGGAEMLGLDFTLTEKLPSGEIRTVELVAGGSGIDVTDANKLEYVDLQLKYLLFQSVSTQLGAFLQGLYDVVPLELLMIFDADELDYVLSGSDEIDVDDWQAHTLDELDTGGTAQKRLLHLPCYDNFWTVVRELSTEERRRLLQFTTGSTRPPLGGFASLTSYDCRLGLFTLRGVPVESTHGNLQSHACFNRLDLPTYWGLQKMRDAVHAAISGDVDGFTID